MVSLEDTIPFTDITLMQLIIAIAILIVGWIAIRVVKGVLRRTLVKTRLPALVVEFLTRLLSVLLWVVIILFAVGALGFDTSAVVLGLSAIMGLIIAFGMQDTFNNFFAGIWIAMIRPLDKDEVVEVTGLKGKVRAVGIMSTELITPDNTFITIPNRSVWGEPIVNYSRMPIRRVDVSVGTAYDGDVNRAIEVAMSFIKEHPLVLNEPAPAVVVTELGDSSVNLALRAWSETADYWTVMGDLTKGIFEEYTKEGIEIPFPQMDVHMDKGG
ncbi:MAG: mechanosensitive ion channel family protein [Methanomassiliicoccales archaeon]|nr:mechanosensitive ion channel family protein [Methanomassiliicoccales archaeon]NYT15530.1 mechanosensitive ion channel family protein [Methanomassiliicoccales archaeon]